MQSDEINLLNINCGVIVAPAGCGKTQLITTALVKHKGSKPILVLTHTNAGVAALRGRLKQCRVEPSIYRLATIDGWAIRLISTFPKRAGHDQIIIESHKPNYRAIREAAFNLLKAGHINDIIRASYSHLIVDEYQDCSIQQHSIITCASSVLPTCVLGDPMQAIFSFDRKDPLADWDKHVCGHFVIEGELNCPWRWINANAEPLGEWLINVRQKIMKGEDIDLHTAPKSVKWIQLNGTKDDHQKMLKAGRISPPGGVGSVLIIGKSTDPNSQHRFASQTPGAVTIEAVDLRDFVSFARDLDLIAPDALERIAAFAQSLMTNVNANDLIRRVQLHTNGSARKQPTKVEIAAQAFQRERTYRRIVDLLVEIKKDTSVRLYRPAVFRTCIQALQICIGENGLTFYDAAIRVREQSRFQGRPLPKRAVGSTLLLKGLEAEVSVILNAEDLDAKNLYVAMTRGSKYLTICSTKSTLSPA